MAMRNHISAKSHIDEKVTDEKIDEVIREHDRYGHGTWNYKCQSLPQIIDQIDIILYFPPPLPR